MESVSGAMKELWPLITTYGIRVLGVLGVLVVAWIVAGLVKRGIHRGLTRSNFDTTLTKFFASAARYTVLALAFIGCLGVFGIETTSFAALLAGAGLAVGLAFQGTLSNLAAGMMLLIFRPFKVGDYVIVGGTAGTVDEITLFTTNLNTLDNRLIIVPNGSVFGATIENVTHHPTRRVDVAVGTSYSADIDKTRQVLEAAAGNVKGILKDPATQIFLAGLGASSVDWQVRAWTNTTDYWDVHQDLTREVKVSLDKAGIEIPFPQLDIHMNGSAVSVRTESNRPEARA